MELIASIELIKRSTIRRLAQGIQCSKSTVARWISQGLLRAHTSATKPAPNKLLRLMFSLEALELDRAMNILKFKGMHNTVHIDEKWFYISKASHTGEVEPYRSCKNKKFITKVMFMCAVSRPIFDSNGGVVFDGKIGIFPLTQRIAAQRNSKNRAAGTMITKPIESITKQVIKDCVIQQIIPSIKEKWPATSSKHIFIQQDNARPHIKDNDPEFRAAASSDGFNIILIHQPPNSPDMNVLDLGWFHSIQSLQVQTASYDVDQLVKVVIESYKDLSPTKLNNVFLSLQGCMMEVMKLKGQNRYKIPHLKKDALTRAHQLPQSLEVEKALVRECIAHLIEDNSMEGLQNLMDELEVQVTMQV